MDVEVALVKMRATIPRTETTWHLGTFAKTLMEMAILMCQSPDCAKITDLAQQVRDKNRKKVTANKKGA